MIQPLDLLVSINVRDMTVSRKRKVVARGLLALSLAIPFAVVGSLGASRRADAFCFTNSDGSQECFTHLRAGVRVVVETGVRSGDAVAMNFTAVNGEAAGFVSVSDCSTTPNSSLLNFVAGVAVPNFAIVQPNSLGQVCLVPSAGVDLIADFAGAVTAKLAANSTRILDTRGQSQRPRAGVPVVVETGVRSGDAVAMNFTAVNGEAAGFVSVSDCSTTPNSSLLNFVAGVAVPNFAIVQPNSLGQVCLVPSAGVDLIADFAGAVTAKLAANSSLYPSIST